MLVENLIKNLELLKKDGIKFIPFSYEKNNNNSDSLEDLKKSIGNCQKCKLSATRENIVFGEGNPNAELMFIGEGPGKHEDLQGRPFVGAAGQLLTKIINAMHLTREDVYIANIVKCRPPNNRDPEHDEIKACLPYLLKQIELIKPKVICTLGRISTKVLLDTEDKITKIRGKIFDYNGIDLIPTYHPAHLLHHPDNKRLVWEDMQLIMKILKLI